MVDVHVTLEMRRSWNIAQRVDVALACVDIGQSPLTYLLFFELLSVVFHVAS